MQLSKAPQNFLPPYNISSSLEINWWTWNMSPKGDIIYKWIIFIGLKSIPLRSSFIWKFKDIWPESSPKKATKSAAFPCADSLKTHINVRMYGKLEIMLKYNWDWSNVSVGQRGNQKGGSQSCLSMAGYNLASLNTPWLSCSDLWGSAVSQTQLRVDLSSLNIFQRLLSILCPNLDKTAGLQ